MSWKDCCLSFVKKYGKAAKVVAGGVLNVVAPGSGTLLALVEQACDNAIETAQDHWEASLLKATQNNTAEMQHQRLHPGDLLDGWLLDARLGLGGWGQVFKATRSGQRRAIKVIHSE